MTDASSEDLPPRLREFQTEVDQLKVSGGAANPERWGMILGGVMFAAAVVIEIVAFSTSRSTDNVLEQRDMIILALLGVVVALGGVALFVRFALTRWFRYWLVRLIYEDRHQTDRIVAALEDD